jgi:hypothetical protein
MQSHSTQPLLQHPMPAQYIQRDCAMLCGKQARNAGHEISVNQLTMLVINGAANLNVLGNDKLRVNPFLPVLPAKS